MKVPLRVALTTLVLSLLPAVTLAGDPATLHVIGFSPDSEYLAFEQYGIQDGSGFAWSEIQFVHVPRNALAGKTVRFRAKSEDVSLQSARREALKQAEATLKKLAIQSGNAPTPRAVREITDLAPAREIRFATELEPIWLPGENPDYVDIYRVALQTRSSGKKCDMGAPDGVGQLLTLSIQSEGKDRKTRTLQQDKAIPKSRGCPLAYRIRQIGTAPNGAHVVVFLAYYQPGFEGVDLRYLVVTGPLP
jgi:predicted secreted protein